MSAKREERVDDQLATNSSGDGCFVNSSVRTPFKEAVVVALFEDADRLDFLAGASTGPTIRFTPTAVRDNKPRKSLFILHPVTVGGVSNKELGVELLMLNHGWDGALSVGLSATEK